MIYVNVYIYSIILEDRGRAARRSVDRVYSVSQNKQINTPAAPEAPEDGAVAGRMRAGLIDGGGDGGGKMRREMTVN